MTKLTKILIIAALGLAGCESDPGSSQPARMSIATALRSESWTYRGNRGQKVITPHYNIYTTLQSEEMIERLSLTMEGALVHYRALVPGVPMSDRAMDCYVFGTRKEWAYFTAENTGSDAKIYLQINRGGYTVRDWYVAYFIGDLSTYSVAAHEGWHQFAARHFRNRLPPFLEEGIATQFENISWRMDTPTWNIGVNANRALRLRQAMDNNTLYPLDKLITMHAGDVVGMKGESIEAFYSQNWAFVKFCLEADGGRYKPAFQKLLADTANGTLFDPFGRQLSPGMGWNPNTVKPILEHYLGADLSTINAAYLRYIKRIAYDKFNDQWRNPG